MPPGALSWATVHSFSEKEHGQAKCACVSGQHVYTTSRAGVRRWDTTTGRCVIAVHGGNTADNTQQVGWRSTWSEVCCAGPAAAGAWNSLHSSAGAVLHPLLQHVSAAHAWGWHPPERHPGPLTCDRSLTFPT